MAKSIRDRIVGHKKVKKSELVPHPLNWRTHPERQRAALRGSLKEVGVARSLLVFPVRKGKNKGKYQLIDGHCRLEEYPDVVPIEILDVTEEEANKLLVTLDPLTALAGTDAPRLRTLLADLKTGDESLASLFSELSEANKLGEGEGLELDIGGGNSPVEGGAGELEASHVRMFQLFLTVDTFPEFEDLVTELAERFGTENPTDTVVEALRRAAGKGKEKRREEGKGNATKKRSA